MESFSGENITEQIVRWPILFSLFVQQPTSWGGGGVNSTLMQAAVDANGTPLEVTTVNGGGGGGKKCLGFFVYSYQGSG